MSVEIWQHFFKPETRSSGRTLSAQGKLSVNRLSDTEVVAYVRVSPPLKVSLKSDSVSDPVLFVDCTCPAAKKDQLCKHIWAGLLATEKKFPDFFDSKSELEKRMATIHFTAGTKTGTKNGTETATSFKSSARVDSTSSVKSEAYEAKLAEYKEQQAKYRKEQYQKQKLRLKELKKKLKEKEQTQGKVELPSDIEAALQYFSTNGIELRSKLNKEDIGAAKKKLARVFHPDLGGSHNEILELNKFSDVLISYVSKK